MVGAVRHNCKSSGTRNMTQFSMVVLVVEGYSFYFILIFFNTI